MTLLIIVLGSLIGLLGVIGVISPMALVRVVEKFWMHQRGLYLAVAIRLVFGAVLIVASPQTRFPLTMLIIGIFALAGAFALPVIGGQRVQGLLRWWASRTATIIRIWAFMTLLFGLFLVYACI